MDTERLLRLPEVCDRVALKKAGVYKAVREGRFPRPLKLGKRAVAWRERAINDWIAERMADIRA
jgi:prophage regulatory protein